jgi:high-affinity Fe2+/Pb2+ permease
MQQMIAGMGRVQCFRLNRYYGCELKAVCAGTATAGGIGWAISKGGFAMRNYRQEVAVILTACAFISVVVFV